MEYERPGPSGMHAYQSLLPEHYTTYIGFEGEAVASLAAEQ
jgi:hypothetical protein